MSTLKPSKYIDLQPFQAWVQQSLPAVYDDSLSYTDLLAKMLAYLNNLVANNNTLSTDVTNAINYINTFFESTDFQDKVDDKLNRMAEDGSLSELIQPLFDAYKTQIDDDVANFKNQTNQTIETQNNSISSIQSQQNTLEQRMDTFTQLSSGSTSGDAELQDIRVGANGVTYPNAGDAVRGQYSQLKEDLGNLTDKNDYHYLSATDYLNAISNKLELSKNTNLFNWRTISDGKGLTYQNGTLSDDPSYFTSDFIPVIKNNTLYFSRNNVSVQNNPISRLCYYDKNKEFLGFKDNIVTYKIPLNAKYIRFSYYTGYNTGLQVEYDKITDFNEYGVVNSTVVDKVIHDNDVINKINNKDLIMPSSLYCVEGHETFVFYDTAIYNDSIKNVPRVKADVHKDEMHSMIDMWYWNPSDGDTTFDNAFRAYFNNTTDVDVTCFVNCKVVPKSNGAGMNKKCLFIGDSITQYGGYLSELVHLFNTDEMNIELIGTRQSIYKDSSGIDVTTRNEGRGGWSAKDYCTVDSKSGVSNPFFYNNNFDFSHYMESNTYSGVDYVFIMLGTNDLANSLTETIGYFTKMINSIKNFNNNIKIFISLCPPLSARDDRYPLKNSRLELVKLIKSNFDGIENVYLVPLYVCIDPFWDFPYVTNEFEKSRCNTDYIYVTDNTHPTASGHYKMADVIYAMIKYVAGR